MSSVSSLPDSCDAVLIEGTGKNTDDLTYGSIPCPRPQDREVLIRVEAAGVNGADILQRKGFYPAPPNASPILGLEAAGEIVACGDKVQTFKVGDKVTAILAGGGYASYCAVHEAQCLPFPDQWNAIHAACIPETFFTAWSNLIDRAQLKEGMSILIHGGSGGVGVAAIQIAKIIGANKIFATARGEDKGEFCRNLGAHITIDYTTQDFVEVIKKETDAKGVDVILDIIGGDYINRNIRSLARDGCLVQLAFRHGSKAELDLMPMMLKRLTLTGSTLRIRSPEFKGKIAAALKKNLWHHFLSKAIDPCLDTTFPLKEAHLAHARLEKSLHKGKIILIP